MASRVSASAGRTDMSSESSAKASRAASNSSSVAGGGSTGSISDSMTAVRYVAGDRPRACAWARTVRSTSGLSSNLIVMEDRFAGNPRRSGAAAARAEQRNGGRLASVSLPWERGRDLNPRPSGYEPDELPDCSTPRRAGDYRAALTPADRTAPSQAQVKTAPIAPACATGAVDGLPATGGAGGP